MSSLLSFGLYRDDSPAVLNRSKCESERATKTIKNIFKSHGFKISVERNLIQTDFLDINMNLSSSTFALHKKKNFNVKYINNGSNHPITIRKAISPMINNILIKLSSNKEIFDSVKKDYNEVLISNGHNKIKDYDKNDLNCNNEKNKRSRKTIYFNPPFCNSVETNIGKKFLDLDRLHFPKNNKFHKIFNKNTIKISYSCLPNIRNIIN